MKQILFRPTFQPEKSTKNEIFVMSSRKKSREKERALIKCKLCRVHRTSSIAIKQ